MRYAGLIFFSLISFFSCDKNSTRYASAAPEIRPRNVILMVGDGMGITQISAALYLNGNKLNLESFPVVGIHKPYSSDNLISDSAAGATAFACGVKTYNGAIGVNADTQAVESILEKAKARGMSAGVIASSAVVHATPAAFVAHVKSRMDYEQIALGFLENEVDFFVGGGKKFFDNRTSDNRNLLKEMEGKEYLVLNDFYDLIKYESSINNNRKIACITSSREPSLDLNDKNYLAPVSKLATNFLKVQSGGRGFFLMIEASKIDWGGHANNADYIIEEMISFDNAIGEILNFAKKDGETLVVVTADHETGGFALNPGSLQDSLITGFTSFKHTGTMIPVFAFGPGAEKFSGIYENTEIYQKIVSALSLQPYQ